MFRTGAALASDVALAAVAAPCGDDDDQSRTTAAPLTDFVVDPGVSVVTAR